MTQLCRVLLCVWVWPTFAGGWIWVVEFAGGANDGIGISVVFIASSLATLWVFDESKHWRRDSAA
jgi:hypothetical protein